MSSMKTCVNSQRILRDKKHKEFSADENSNTCLEGANEGGEVGKLPTGVQSSWDEPLQQAAITNSWGLPHTHWTTSLVPVKRGHWWMEDRPRRGKKRDRFLPECFRSIFI